MQLTEYQSKAIEKFMDACHNGQWSDVALAEILKIISSYGNAVTLSRHCKHTGANYNTEKKKAVDFGGVKFILDNQ
jgi:hypothetical protein